MIENSSRVWRKSEAIVKCPNCMENEATFVELAAIFCSCGNVSGEESNELDKLEEDIINMFKDGMKNQISEISDVLGVEENVVYNVLLDRNIDDMM